MGYSIRSAFTLIELLTVIAIIALLASLLMPALTSIKVAARKTQCLSNLRQLAVGLHGYAYDNEQLLPYHGGDVGHTTFNDTLEGISRYLTIRNLNTVVSGSLNDDAFTGTFSCPADQRTYANRQYFFGDTTRGGRGRVFTSYCSSDLAGGLGLSNGNWFSPAFSRRTTTGELSAKRAVLWDGYQRDPVQTTHEGYFRPKGTNRHRAGMNAAFGDGHTSWLDMKPIPAGADWDLGGNTVPGFYGANRVFFLGTGAGSTQWSLNANSKFVYPWCAYRIPE